ncbi:hypothetical protein L1049_016166 [Liquidambar formosana]|uniref:Uncharacterized protein n=1 Tax=Liquidambar formosana TaxID=63359 RepID=A0AAP0X2Z1_LIQFO
MFSKLLALHKNSTVFVLSFAGPWEQIGASVSEMISIWFKYFKNLSADFVWVDHAMFVASFFNCLIVKLNIAWDETFSLIQFKPVAWFVCRYM